MKILNKKIVISTYPPETDVVWIYPKHGVYVIHHGEWINIFQGSIDTSKEYNKLLVLLFGQYDDSTEYNEGDVIVKDGQVCTLHGDNWYQIEHDMIEATITKNLATDYDENVEYSVGDIVVKDGILQTYVETQRIEHYYGWTKDGAYQLGNVTSEVWYTTEESPRLESQLYVKDHGIFQPSETNIRYLTIKDKRILIEVNGTRFIRNLHYDEVVEFPGETKFVWKQLSLIDYIKNNNN